MNRHVQVRFIGIGFEINDYNIDAIANYLQSLGVRANWSTKIEYKNLNEKTRGRTPIYATLYFQHGERAYFEQHLNIGLSKRIRENTLFIRNPFISFNGEPLVIIDSSRIPEYVMLFRDKVGYKSFRRKLERYRLMSYEKEMPF